MVVSPRVKIVLIISAIGVLVILAAFLVVKLKGFSPPRRGETLKKTVSPTPTPLPLAPGRQIYTIQSDSKSPGPAISEASFDPLDGERGGQITVEVKAKDATTMTVIMIDDSGKNPHELSLSNNIWSGSWTVESTHNRIYGATIEATNSKGEKRTVELWFR